MELDTKLKFTGKIIEKSNLFNSVFKKLNTLPLFENPDFSTNGPPHDSYLNFSLCKLNSNNISMNIILDEESIVIYLDRAAEIIGWSNEHIKNSRESVLKMIETLFKSYFLVEYYGRSYTRICLFNAQGICTNIFTYRNGFGFKRKRFSKLYFPVYP